MKKNFTFNHNPLLSEKLPVWRARFVLVLLLAGFVALGCRAAWLQGVKTDFLQAKGESRYARVIELPADRGKIIDRHGEVLAVSTPVRSVWAIPDDISLTPAQTRELARMLALDPAELNRKLASDKEFVYLKRQVPPDIADRVAALNLPGIHTQNEFRRFYPSGEVAAHVVGFTDVDDNGQEGIELAFQKDLLGHAGSRRVIKDRRGHIVEDVESIKKPREGSDVTLALDSKIQYLAYSALKQAVTVNKAKAGSAVVIDVKTGEILALVNSPTYNPNNRVRLSGAQLRNRVLTDTFEPGSTMKPFTAAAALESGKFRFDTIINCAPGRMTIGSATISDAHPHGALTVAQVIQKSSNIGSAKMSLALPAEQMWEMYDALGFGSQLKLGFPGEAAGRLRPARIWRPIEQATMSYGHGISVNLMQLAQAYLVFAREGDLIPLSLTRVETPPLHGKPVFSQQTAREVRAMLETVTQPGGTATLAQVPGYRVGGKTGTAMKLEGGVYTNKYVSSFVGLGPISNPRLIVAVMVDEPTGGKHYGGEVAAPVFSELMAGSLRALGVPPDAPLRPMQVAQTQRSDADVKEGM
ncbi:penicillin-binding protein 2 [Niveibacterium umoris]|uniref:Peptidoglycan D,D-transpeptidase FtsI n=1 Tax=Niveibacterium umoris TaxID=1193620 RepID=A0A840BMP4_9RHOO|nr:penicillin-binding protein 2 [Niveibacterium umoris]MBB4014515.1 cell division protein FtsI (penicillin-binding protein 3) [Niveibacterium umoris]